MSPSVQYKHLQLNNCLRITRQELSVSSARGIITIEMVNQPSLTAETDRCHLRVQMGSSVLLQLTPCRLTEDIYRGPVSSCHYQSESGESNTGSDSKQRFPMFNISRRSKILMRAISAFYVLIIGSQCQQQGGGRVILITSGWGGRGRRGRRRNWGTSHLGSDNDGNENDPK